jgi:hypothetical protein
LPHPDFFRFCYVLLDYYADNDMVSVVTGDNFQSGRRRGTDAYYFSKYNHCWGWATWRNAWQHYQGDLSFWPTWKRSEDWQTKVPDAVERRYWGKIFDRVHAHQIDSWAYPWTGSVWYHGGLTVTPNVNLVSNIGFGVDGTHTKSNNKTLSNLPTMSLGVITHPTEVIQNIEADTYVFDYAFGGRNLRQPRILLRAPRVIAVAIYRMLRKSIAI